MIKKFFFTLACLLWKLETSANFLDFKPIAALDQATRVQLLRASQRHIVLIEARNHQDQDGSWIFNQKNICILDTYHTKNFHKTQFPESISLKPRAISDIHENGSFISEFCNSSNKTSYFFSFKNQFSSTVNQEILDCKSSESSIFAIKNNTLIEFSFYREQPLLLAKFPGEATIDAVSRNGEAIAGTCSVPLESSEEKRLKLWIFQKPESHLDSNDVQWIPWPESIPPNDARVYNVSSDGCSAILEITIENQSCKKIYFLKYNQDHKRWEYELYNTGILCHTSDQPGYNSLFHVGDSHWHINSYWLASFELDEWITRLGPLRENGVHNTLISKKSKPNKPLLFFKEYWSNDESPSFHVWSKRDRYQSIFDYLKKIYNYNLEQDLLNKKLSLIDVQMSNDGNKLFFLSNDSQRKYYLASLNTSQLTPLFGPEDFASSMIENGDAKGKHFFGRAFLTTKKQHEKESDKTFLKNPGESFELIDFTAHTLYDPQEQKIKDIEILNISPNGKKKILRFGANAYAVLGEDGIANPLPLPWGYDALEAHRFSPDGKAILGSIAKFDKITETSHFYISNKKTNSNNTTSEKNKKTMLEPIMKTTAKETIPCYWSLGEEEITCIPLYSKREVPKEQVFGRIYTCSNNKKLFFGEKNHEGNIRACLWMYNLPTPIILPLLTLKESIELADGHQKMILLSLESRISQALCCSLTGRVIAGHSRNIPCLWKWDTKNEHTLESVPLGTITDRGQISCMSKNGEILGGEMNDQGYLWLRKKNGTYKAISVSDFLRSKELSHHLSQNSKRQAVPWVSIDGQKILINEQDQNNMWKSFLFEF